MWAILAILTRLAAASSNDTSPENCVLDGGIIFGQEDPSLCTHMRIEEGVTTIPSDVLSRYSNLTSVDIPESVTTIESDAFNSCTNLNSINIPSSVTEIGASAFEGCTSLTSVNISENVTRLNSSVFENCTSLTSVNIPERVTRIGSWAFAGCVNLTSVNLPNSLTTIARRAFNDCTRLTSINIENVTGFGENVFGRTQILDPFDMSGLDFQELPKDSKKVIPFTKCQDQFDAVALEELKVGETVFAIPAGSKIYCFSIATVQNLVQHPDNRLNVFVHPMSREKFNVDQMRSFKKIIIIRDDLEQEHHDFQEEVIGAIENDNNGKRTRM